MLIQCWNENPICHQQQNTFEMERIIPIMEGQHSSQTSLNSFCFLLNRAAPFFSVFCFGTTQYLQFHFCCQLCLHSVIIPHLSRCVYVHMLEVCILFGGVHFVCVTIVTIEVTIEVEVDSAKCWGVDCVHWVWCVELPLAPPLLS